MRMQSKTRALLAMTLMLAAASGIAGCAGASHEEEEHADHVIPAHKPANFVEAVKALESRFASAPESPEAVQELQDIIDWLPELAAQTDLEKADWDRVQEISIALSGTMKEKQTADDQVRRQLDELRTLAKRAIEVDRFNTYDEKDVSDV